MTTRRITIKLLGHFGAENYGNESTLQAMLSHLRRIVPEADITCICSVPTRVTQDYKIAAVGMRGIAPKPWSVANPVARLFRKVFVGIPCELYRWFEAVVALRGADGVIVVGTGLLTDAFSLFGWGPYNTFKWALIAKLCGSRLLFVSVGAGPLNGTWAKWFTRWALALADFRSYRDRKTVQYLRSIGFYHAHDPVYPDLAFSLTPDTLPDKQSLQNERPIVALGIMALCGMYGIEKTTDAHYAAYFAALTWFGTWLIDRGYDIHLLIGDVEDASVAREFQCSLCKLVRPGQERRVIAKPISSPKDLLTELEGADLVVATRYHNTLLALLLEKPAISIAFHHKCYALMEEMGLQEFCIDIRNVRGDHLVERFLQLESRAPKLKTMIAERVSEYSETLDEQYMIIARELLGKGHHKLDSLEGRS